MGASSPDLWGDAILSSELRGSLVLIGPDRHLLKPCLIWLGAGGLLFQGTVFYCSVQARHDPLPTSPCRTPKINKKTLHKGLQPLIPASGLRGHRALEVLLVATEDKSCLVHQPGSSASSNTGRAVARSTQAFLGASRYSKTWLSPISSTWGFDMA